MISFKEFVDGMRKDRNIFSVLSVNGRLQFEAMTTKMQELLESYEVDAADDNLDQVLGLKGTDAEGGICIGHIDCIYRNLLLALFGP